MFGIGFGEMLIIALVLLLAVGPKELPSLLKSVGKGVRDLRRASDDLRRSAGIDQLLQDDDLKNSIGSLRSDFQKSMEGPDQGRKELKLSPADREREAPAEGVDLAYARQRADLNSRLAQSSPALAEAQKPGGPLPEGG